MKISRIYLLVLDLYIIVSLSQSQMLEYRLWKNYGQVIHDYSNNNLHGYNGISINDTIEDCLFTDRGVYLNTRCRVEMPKFQSPNPLSIVIWAISDGSIYNARLFCRYHSNFQFLLYRDNSRARVVSSGIGSQILSEYNNNWQEKIWILTIIEINQQNMKVYRNLNLILEITGMQIYNENSTPFTTHIGTDKNADNGFGGFVWFLAFYNEIGVAKYHVSSNFSSNCFIGSCYRCKESFIFPELGVGCGPISTDILADSNDHTCPEGFGCRGSLKIQCDCPSKSCEFNFDNTCNCIQTTSTSNYQSSCICNSGGQGCCKNECASCLEEFKCLKCKDINSHLVDGNCVCNEGYTNNISDPELSCIKCNEKCSKCSSVNYCINCTDPNSYPSNGDCICTKGFYQDSSLITFKCQKCHPQCKACSQYLPCTECQENSTLLYNPSQTCQCNEGYSNISDKGVIIQCLCGEGSYEEQSKCIPCTFPCETCLSSSHCLTCSNPIFTSINGLCQCPKGYYEVSSECKPCEFPCETCSSAAYCLSCLNPIYILVHGQCKCPHNYFENSSNCYPCTYPCKSCSSNQYCLSCDFENSILENGACNCKPGFYTTFEDSGKIVCSPCEGNCKTCFSKEKCLSCVDEKMDIDSDNDCVCVDGFYMSQFNSCEQCNSTCKTCESKFKCFECFNTSYELVNNKKCLGKCENNLMRIGEDCGCGLGFRQENNSCVEYHFGFQAFVGLDNRIFIEFDQFLSKSLKKHDININTSKELSFRLFEKSKYQIYLILNLQESITASTNLTIELKSPIYSDKNAILKEYLFTVFLNEFIYIDPSTKALIENIKSTGAAMATTSIGISIISNPAAAWAMIGTLQLLPYIPLSKFYNDSTTTEFLASVGDFNLLPNIMTYAFDKNSSSIPFSRAKIIGIETSVFWINIGKVILPFLFFISIWPILYVVSKIKLGDLDEKILNILKNYKYSFFLRFWIQSYLDLGIYSIIQLKSQVNHSNSQFIINMCSATFTILLVVISPVLVGIRLYYSYKKVKNNSISHSIKFGTLYNEFKHDKGFLSIFYYVFYLGRRLQFMLTQVFLNNSEIAQNIINTVFGYLMLAYMIYYRPFKESLIQISFMVSELTFSCIFTSFMIFSLTENWMPDMIYHNIVIFSVIVCMGIQFCISLVQLIIALKKSYCDYLTHRNKKIFERCKSKIIHDQRILDRH